MSTSSKISTYALLGWQFFIHTFRKVVFRRKSAGYNEFLHNFSDDNIVPFSRDERERLGEYGGCIACGLCDPVCPSLRACGDGRFAGPADMAICLSRNPVEMGGRPDPFLSVMCGACDNACPENVPVVEIISYMRRKARQTNPELLPEFYRAAIHNLETGGNVFGAPSPAEKNAHGDILYWRGCGTARKTASGEDDVHALMMDAMGIKYRTMSEKCCGGLPGRMGLDYNNSPIIEEITQSSIRTIVAACPLCLKTLRESLPDVRTRHVISVVVDKLDGSFKPLAGQRVAYHDPCVLGRGLRIYDPPREIIAKLGADIATLPRERENAPCCGAGGALSEVAPDMADTIARDRIDEVIASGASALLTACDECARQLKKVADEEKVKLSVKTISEIIISKSG